MKPHYDILIIDDEPSIRESLKEALEMDGCSVATAANGREAYRLLRKIDPPKLILLDLFMPVMSGYEFLQEKPMHPEIARTPVIVVSAAGSGIEGSGIHGFLRKPIDLDLLQNVISKYVH